MNIPPPSLALSLFLSGLVCLFNSPSVFFSVGLNAYILSWRQKTEWHTVVPQSESSDMVIKSLFSLGALAYQNTNTRTQTQELTSNTKQHKQKSPFDKSHQPKHSLYSPLARRSALHPFKLPFFLFVSGLSRCVGGFVWRLLWPAERQCADSIC